ncbi:MAG: squalene/phytoene synthase family protein, partial [Phycisphaerae bacterium]|nr:squalene/phytoene synthase family protein [Phycisphaerae bacterium]
MSGSPARTESTGQRLQVSQDHCRQVARTRAGSFYPGMRLVPGAKRSAMEALYAWMRTADDLADAPGDAADKRRRLLEFQQETRRAIAAGAAPDVPEGPIWPAVRHMMGSYGIDPAYLEQMIEGQLADLDPARYATFDQLYDYCYKVASVVGLCCIEIWGYEGGEPTRKLSEWRGIAFQ